MSKQSIYGLTFDQLTVWFLEHGHKKFRATQVWDWLYIKRVKTFADMRNINKELIQLLEEHFYIQSLNVKYEARIKGRNN